MTNGQDNSIGLFTVNFPRVKGFFRFYLNISTKLNVFTTIIINTTFGGQQRKEIYKRVLGVTLFI